jgi:hypothetical protein
MELSRELLLYVMVITVGTMIEAVYAPPPVCNSLKIQALGYITENMKLFPEASILSLPKDLLELIAILESAKKILDSQSFLICDYDNLYQVQNLNKILAQPICQHVILWWVRNKPWAHDIYRQLQLIPRHNNFVAKANQLAQVIKNINSIDELEQQNILPDQVQLVKQLFFFNQEMEKHKIARYPEPNLGNSPLKIETLLSLLNNSPVYKVKIEENCLFEAVAQNYQDTVNYFLERGVSPNTRHSLNNFSLLDTALSHTATPMVQLLLKKGAQATTLGPDRLSPLYRAVLCCYVKGVELLLDHGASADIVTPFNNTSPLHLVRQLVEHSEYPSLQAKTILLLFEQKLNFQNNS